MPHKELFICGHRSNIKADLKIPDNPLNVGIIMSHGGIVNRNSLSRSTLSLAEYFSRRLNAYVLTPDLLGETIYDRDTIEYSDGVNLLSTCIDYLADEMGVDRILGFGHSMGCTLLADAAYYNPKMLAISTYGGPLSFERYWKLLNPLGKVMNKLEGHLSEISLKKLMWIFDEETVSYYYNVMTKKKEYGSNHYNFDYPYQYMMGFFRSFVNYTRELERWSKPSLVLYGKKDSFVRFSRFLFPDGYRDKKVLVKHIDNGCHVTPCREEPLEILKMEPVIPFFQQIIDNY